MKYIRFLSIIAILFLLQHQSHIREVLLFLRLAYLHADNLIKVIRFYRFQLFPCWLRAFDHILVSRHVDHRCIARTFFDFVIWHYMGSQCLSMSLYAVAQTGLSCQYRCVQLLSEILDDGAAFQNTSRLCEGWLGPIIDTIHASWQLSSARLRGEPNRTVPPTFLSLNVIKWTVTTILAAHLMFL